MGFWTDLTRRARDLARSGDPAATETATPTPEGAPDEAPPAIAPEKELTDEEALDSVRGVTRVGVASIASPSVKRLLRFGEVGGPDEREALTLLGATRKTSEEGLALDGLVRRGRLYGMPRELLLAVASALIDRGDRAEARALLETTDDTASLVLRADLIADDHDYAGALATIERVLVRDIDLPGARERRRQYRARLGLGDVALRIDPATMTIATARPRTPFDLVRELARGGAGVVYLAKDRELGRLVALKVYHQPERDRAQLLHEGRVAAALEGPGVVRVFDIDPNDGWLVLEWASQGALRDRLRAPSASAWLGSLDAWLPALAEALARVHAAGWVHHDVKPANVLIAEEPDGALPTPWLADFGSARRIGEPSPPGSLGYVSPERLAGRASDPRDDVYGFGRVLEDVLAAVPEAIDAARWKALAAACVGPSDARPADGIALVARLARVPVGTPDATR